MKAEPLFTANRLALLAKLDRRAVERKLATITPDKIEGNARYYSLATALPALAREPEDVEYQKRMRALREREQIAATDLAELQKLRTTNEIVAVSKQMWHDGVLDGVRRISNLPLTDAQKGECVRRAPRRATPRRPGRGIETGAQPALAARILGMNASPRTEAADIEAARIQCLSDAAELEKETGMTLEDLERAHADRIIDQQAAEEE